MAFSSGACDSPGNQDQFLAASYASSSCQHLELGCVQVDFSRVGRRKIVLVRSGRCSAQEAAIVAVPNPVVTWKSFPGSVVCSYTGVEVSKDNNLVCYPRSRQKDVQVLVELSNWRAEGTDDGDELTSAKMQTQNHQAIIASLHQTRKPSDNGFMQDKDDANIKLLRF
ncbi:unnamed protein product [Schistocephalus solidus]|uniref:Uncharacterized protein n=1 Tax=Schistocephalus solidus TaxID=70667 RepID=A0A183TCA2_SCHSO|nr:unnamed protein product [Schistocephalus solidus]